MDLSTVQLATAFAVSVLGAWFLGRHSRPSPSPAPPAPPARQPSDAGAAPSSRSRLWWGLSFKMLLCLFFFAAQVKCCGCPTMLARRDQSPPPPQMHLVFVRWNIPMHFKDSKSAGPSFLDQPSGTYALLLWISMSSLLLSVLLPFLLKTLLFSIMSTLSALLFMVIMAYCFGPLWLTEPMHALAQRWLQSWGR